MGLLKHLLFWPVTGPKALIEFSLRQVEGVARSELTDDTKVKEDLLALQMELELGDIDDDEYVRREAELMQRLREVRAWRQEFGLEEAWSPLSFAGPEQADADDERVSADGADESWSPDDSSSDSPPDSSS